MTGAQKQEMRPNHVTHAHLSAQQTVPYATRGIPRAEAISIARIRDDS